MKKELLVTGAKIAGATLTGLFVVGSQEAFLSDLRRRKNAINKARERNEIHNPIVLQRQPEVSKELEESFAKNILNELKEAAARTSKEVVNITQLGTVRSMESFIQEEQKELLRRQNGNIHRLINKHKN